jgi:ATP-dependent HslUV protease ATP-binding subunit HslU
VSAVNERTRESTDSVKTLTPRQVVEELDRYIVGQARAKRAVAIAMRNRWRRQQLPETMRADVAPKNILMIGSTGVGKTEIARRLARIGNAPFVKVEATKYTEVGYYGRDVESMVRELLDNAIGIVRERERRTVEEEARKQTTRRLLDLLLPRAGEAGGFGTVPAGETADDEASEPPSRERTRAKIEAKLLAGDLDQREVELSIEQKPSPVMVGGIGVEQMDFDMQGMLEKIMPKSTTRRRMPVSEARKVIFEQECERLLDNEKINGLAIELAENLGIIFVDEIDKVIASDSRGADVSRQGVQRDLLPIVEGTTVQTRQGYIRTDHILFVAAGAFHKNSPGDLMPELQGRFPIRVELDDLTEDDFARILTEPENSLVRQYQALLQADGIELEFTPEAIRELARFAWQVNQSSQNIGARRLYTILERVLETYSFEAPDMPPGRVVIDAQTVRERLAEITEDQDLSRFIL